MFSLVNRLVGVVDDPDRMPRICERLLGLGVVEADIDVLIGRDGAVRLDSTGGTGWWHRMVRVSQYLLADQSTDYLIYDAALRDGRAVVAVHIRDRSLKPTATAILEEEGAHLMSFFGRIQTEQISAWRGEELVLPSFVPDRVDPNP